MQTNLTCNPTIYGTKFKNIKNGYKRGNINGSDGGLLKWSEIF